MYTHISPLTKKDADFRRVVMDLSWPDGASVNDGVNDDTYIDGSARITLPTVDFMEARLLSLGRGAYMYKTDLAQGYRQLRVDPRDCPSWGSSIRVRSSWTCAPLLALSPLLCVCRGPQMSSLTYMPRGVTVHAPTSTILVGLRQRRGRRRVLYRRFSHERTGNT